MNYTLLRTLPNKAVQATFDKFGLTDTFAASEQYDRLYTEITGTIVLLIESNKLPTVRQAEEASPKKLLAKAHAKSLMPFLIVQRYDSSQSALQGQVLRMERRISTVGFFFFKSVLPSSISVRSYSSLPIRRLI